MQEALDSAQAYGIGALLVALPSPESFLTWGGIVVVIVRLIADAPRAWNTIKRVFRK